MEKMFPGGNNILSVMNNSNGSDEKRIKFQGKAIHNLENYPLFCKEIAIKQKNFESFENFVHLKC